MPEIKKTLRVRKILIVDLSQIKWKDIAEKLRFILMKKLESKSRMAKERNGSKMYMVSVGYNIGISRMTNYQKQFK